MINIGTLLSYIILFGALAFPGFILGKSKRLSEESLGGIAVILTDVAMPFLVFAKLLETDLSSISTVDIVCSIVFPVAICFILWGISSFVFKKAEDRRRSVFSFCSVFANCGFLGIPLANAIFPDSPEICAFVALFNVFSTFMLLTLGVYMLSGDRRHISLRGAFFKPITFAVMIGVVLSLSGGGEYISGLALYSDILASMTTPLAMLVLGVEMSRIGFKELFLTPALYASAAIKLIASPLITVGVLAVLRALGITVSEELAAALFISTGVSTAATASAMSKQYGRDGRYAAVLTVGNTVLCALTLPIVSIVFGFVF